MLHGQVLGRRRFAHCPSTLLLLWPCARPRGRNSLRSLGRGSFSTRSSKVSQAKVAGSAGPCAFWDNPPRRSRKSQCVRGGSRAVATLTLLPVRGEFLVSC